MKKELNAIEDTFLAQGWRTITGDFAPLSKVFQSSYETVGVLATNTVDSLLNSWRDGQERMNEVRDKSPRLPRDLYLLLVVPQLEEGYDRISEILNNTQVCRKICLETSPRGVAIALSDLPFFRNTLVGGTADDTVREREFGSIWGLSEDLRRDLSKASADTVLEKLLAGQYSDAPSLTDSSEVEHED